MKNIFCNFRGLMMMGLTICLMFCSGGCGEQQDQTEDVKELVATGGAVYVDGNQDTEAVRKQLELFVKNFDKWRIDADKNKYLEIGYAVTDLDHNGRLEIMALSFDWQDDSVDDGYILRKCFEVNPAGDGIDKIGTEQIQDVPLGYGGDIGKFHTAYFDPETGEYHYVMEGAGNYDEDGDEDDYTDIIALTMKDGQITQTTLGTYDWKGKKYQYFRVDAGEKTEITEEGYSVEKLGDFSYPNFGKFDVWFSIFTSIHDLEEHIYHGMERAYEECFQGYPLEKQEKKIHGYPVEVPQYTTIQDSGKQERINRMICEQVEQSLSDAYGDLQDTEFRLDYADITIKYAGQNRVSLLLEARGYHEGSVTANEHCDTINIDLKQEKLLSGQDILPEQYREDIEEEIEQGDAEGFHGGKDYQKWLEEKEADLFPTMRAEGWQDVKIYQTRDEAGVVIPTKFGLDAYVIYEFFRYWDAYEYMEDKGVAYADVDWEAFRYKMLASEYQSLQSYMPVLMGECEFTMISEDWSDDDEIEIERENFMIADLAREYAGEDFPDEEFTLSCISVCDVTQDGKDEVVLEFLSPGGFYVILHQEGDTYYGTFRGRRSMYDLQKNGVYGAGKGGLHFYQTRFEKDTFVETYIGGYEITWDSETGKEHYKYEIGEKEVEKSAYKKWEKSIAAQEALWYDPEILPEKIEKSKSEH